MAVCFANAVPDVPQSHAALITEWRISVVAGYSGGYKIYI
jgi:hypothetical protein